MSEEKQKEFVFNVDLLYQFVVRICPQRSAESLNYMEFGFSLVWI